MMTVRDILERKGAHVWSVAPNESVYRALETMSEKRVGALMVLDRGRLVGVVSERDYARKVVLRGRVSRDTPVSDIMTGRVLTVTPSQTVEECMALMTNHSVRHLPVLDGNELRGVVSIGDVVKAKISHQEFIIDQLEHFITGS